MIVFPAVLAAVAMLGPPLPAVAPPYAHLPDERTCEAMWHAANADTADLRARWRALGGDQAVPDGGWEFVGGGGGWQAQEARRLMRESEQVASLWYACWWVTWHQATAEQREEWADRLGQLVGADAFWHGRLPMPLSLRPR